MELTFGQNLAKERKQAGISQEELAEKLHLTRQTISKWETGASAPDVEGLWALCQALDVSADRLVEGAVEALEFHVDRDPDLVNVPLRELKLRSGVLIAGIVRRDGEIVIPGGNDTIRAGDDVIVVTQDTALQELRDILRQG